MNRRLALIALAVILALAGTFVVYNYAHNADQRAVASTGAANVLIVQKRVPAGTSWSDVLKGNYLQAEKIPIDSAPSSAITTLNASIPVGEVASADIPAGQIALRPMFGESVPVTGALPIPKGKLALTVTMSAAGGVAGFVQPQSEVAIFATYKLPVAAGASPAANAPGSGSGGSATKVIFARVEVLATSQAAPGDLNKAAGGGGLLTLALTQTEAEQLILASTTSTLYLGLLSDTSVTSPDAGVAFSGKLTPIQLAK